MIKKTDPHCVVQLLRPMYPGQFPSIKGNLFNVVLALDLSQTANLHFIVGPMSNILERNIPFRFGVVPIAETEDGQCAASFVRGS